MKTAILVAAVLVFSMALAFGAAKPLDLGVKTPEYMKTTCAKVRGVFVDIEGKMSCVFPRGVVRCDEGNHCYGYPKHPRPPASQPSNPPAPQYPQEPDWQWHGNNYRW